MPDERKLFEEWFAAAAMPLEADWFRRDDIDTDAYDAPMTDCAWRAWQARSTLQKSSN